MGQEPQGTEAIIDSDDNYVTLLHELRRNVVIAFANGQCTAVDPYHYGRSVGAVLLSSLVVGREDV